MTAVLEAGAAGLQDKTPVDQIALYRAGFHASNDNPTMHMEATHHCNQVNQDSTQCELYDGNTKEARLMGIEYIIGAMRYATLPAGERVYWHPHYYEASRTGHRTLRRTRR